MSQYFLISSAYRNRLLYPNPGKFVVPFGSNNNVNLNIFNVFTTTNPTSTAFPVYNNCWTNFGDVENVFLFPTKIVGGSNSAPVVEPNVNRDLLGVDPNPKPTERFYLEQPLDKAFDILKSFLFVVELDGIRYVRIISGYDPIKSQLVLMEPLPIFDLEGGPISCSIAHPFFDMQEQQGTIVINGPFLGASTFTIFDFEFYVYNLTVNEVRKVISFSTSLSRAVLERPFSDKASIIDQYQLLTQTRPIGLGKLLPFPDQCWYQFVPDNFHWQTRGSNWRVNDIFIFRTLHDSQEDVKGFPKYRVVSVGPLGEIQDIELHELGSQKLQINQPYILDHIHANNSSATVFIVAFSLIFHLRFSDDYQSQFQLVGNYFFPLLQSQQYVAKGDKISVQPTNTIAPDGVFPENNPVIRENTTYDLLESQSTCGVTGIKRVVRLGRESVIIYTQNYSSLSKFDILAKNIQDIPPFFRGIDNFLILPFSSEGVVPLNFTGTQITQTQMSCYNMSITNLILPNRILAVGDGLLTSSYPFVFVSITNENNPNGGGFNRFCSNNPFATKALFICSISDVNNPDTTKFIKISSDGATQNVKFSPVDSLGIEVSLPNGVSFQTEDTDYIVPQMPNPLLQITLFVEVQKVD